MEICDWAENFQLHSDVEIARYKTEVIWAVFWNSYVWTWSLCGFTSVSLVDCDSQGCFVFPKGNNWFVCGKVKVVNSSFQISNHMWTVQCEMKRFVCVEQIFEIAMYKTEVFAVSWATASVNGQWQWCLACRGQSSGASNVKQQIIRGAPAMDSDISKVSILHVSESWSYVRVGAEIRYARR